MRPRLLMAVFLICSSTQFIAQGPDKPGDATTSESTPEAKPPAPPPATAHITGSVLCDDTHRPARGAVVMAFEIPDDGPASRTGPMAPMARVATDGTYSIDHLRAGNYTIIALLPGYLSPFDDMPINENESEDSPLLREVFTRNGVISLRGNETAHKDVTIKRGASVSGRVTYADGAPATQTMIYVEEINPKPDEPKTQNPGGNQRMVFGPGATAGAFLRNFALHQNEGTNDRGDFRISGIKPGTYRIAAVLPSSTTRQIGIFGVEDDAKALHVYSSDTLHKNAAKTYELKAGDDISDADITIPLDIFRKVQGQFTALDGRPIPFGSLTLTDASDDTFVLHATVARDGTFLFPEVPPATYKLTITGAKIGTIPNDFDGMPVEAAMLQNPQALADTTTTILVKDDDVTDLNIQLQNAAPAANQPTTPAASTQ